MTRSSTSSVAADDILVHSVDGPSPVHWRLSPPTSYRMGRRSTCELILQDNRVSREHAVFSFSTSDRARGSGWSISDLGSRHGTWVNGVQLSQDSPVPLQVGDVIGIAAWTLQIQDPNAPRASTTLRVNTRDDGAGRGGSTIAPIIGAQAPSHKWLQLLLQCATTINRSETMEQLADSVLGAAESGVRIANMAVLGPLGPDGQIDIIAKRGQISESSHSAQFSRSLIREAAKGKPVKLRADTAGSNYGQSIIDLGIDEALCIPLMLGPSAAGFLYLDVRGGGENRITDDARQFLLGLAELASMALSNLKRRDLERRQAVVEADITAAGEAHKWILPKRQSRVGKLEVIGESRPGRAALGGDFFDVLPLTGDRLAIAVGDVTGKGIAASILMTASQSFLHGALERHGDPGAAVTELNRFVMPRSAGRFVTLWVGVFDAEAGVLRFIDAGHGHAMMVESDGSSRLLRDKESALVGIDADSSYTSEEIAIHPGCRALIVSDGLVEQIGSKGEDAPDEFGIQAVLKHLKETPREVDAVASLFERVHAFASSARLSDDATAVLVRW